MLKYLHFSAVKKGTDEQTLRLCATFEFLLAVMLKGQVLREVIACGLVTFYQSILRNISEDVDLHCYMYYNEK
jgi:hypothetical protein